MKKLQFVRLRDGRLINIFSITSISPLYSIGEKGSKFIVKHTSQDELFFTTHEIGAVERNKIISAIEKFGTIHG